MGSSHYIISELAQIEGELMGYHEGLDMMGKEANLSNLSSGLLEQSKKLNKIAKDIIGMESDWKKKVEGLREYMQHDRMCAISGFSAGRPTKDGGYEVLYGGKWYQSKPVDKTPKCNCGLDDLLKEE